MSIWRRIAFHKRAQQHGRSTDQIKMKEDAKTCKIMAHHEKLCDIMHIHTLFELNHKLADADDQTFFRTQEVELAGHVFAISNEHDYIQYAQKDWYDGDGKKTGMVSVATSLACNSHDPSHFKPSKLCCYRRAQLVNQKCCVN